MNLPLIGPLESKPLKKRRTLKKNESLSIFISPRIDRARQNILKSEVLVAPLVVEDDGSESSTATEKETSELETESDMEDWDKEFGFETPVQSTFSGKLKGLEDDFVPAPSPLKVEGVPAQHKISNLAEETVNVTIATFPKAPQLFSIAGKDGRSYLSETQFFDWISNHTTKHVRQGLFHRQVKERDFAAEVLLKLPELICDVKAAAFPQLTLEIAESCLREYFNQWILRQFEDCEFLSNRFFTALEKTHVSEPLFWVALEMLRFCGKNPTSVQSESYSKNASVLKALFPEWALIVNVVGIEVELHHLTTWESHRALSNIAALCDFFNSVSSRENTKYNLHAKIAILTDLQFIISGLSPLTLDNNNEEGQHDRNSSLLLPELSQSFSFFVDSKKRMEALAALYPKLEVSQGKAKAAYALGLYHLDIHDTQNSEKLLYECLYILDQMESKRTALPPIISELGTQAAVSFGDVLLVNHKYKYAIESYEGALVNMRMRRKFAVHGQGLARKIAMVASNNKDGPRALQYYLHILEQAKHESKINEVVHVTLVASNLLQDRSDFEGVETILVNSMEFLKAQLGGSLSSRSQPVYWSLPLRLCEAYIAFSHLERGMSTIQTLLVNDNVPSNKLGNFCYLLALIYSKKGWVKDSFEVVDMFNHPLRSTVQLCEVGSHENHVVFHLSRDKPLMGFITVPQEYSLELIKLIAWNCIQSHQYSKALQVIEGVLDPTKFLAPKTSASFCYLRGLLYEHCGNVNKIIKGAPESLDTLPSLVERKKALISVGKKQKSRGSLIVNTDHRRQTSVQSEPGSPSPFGISRTERLHSAENTPLYRRHTSSVTHIERSEEGMKGAQQNFAKSAEFSLPANDQLRLAKAKCKFVSVYLSSVFIQAVFAHPGERINIDSQEATLKKMMDHAQSCYIFALSTLHLGLLFNGCLNLAEINFLLKKETLALAYWKECRDLFFNLYMHHSDFLMADKASVSVIRKCLATLKRMARLLLSFGSVVVNENIFVLDAVVKLELVLHQALDRVPAEGVDTIYSLSLSSGTIKSLGKAAGDKMKAQTGATLSHKESTSKPKLWSIFPKGKDKDPFSNDENASAVPKSYLRRNRVSIRNQDIDSAKTKVLDRLWCYHCRIKANFKKFSKGEMNEEAIWEANDALLKKIRKLSRTLRNPILSLSTQGQGDPASLAAALDPDSQQQHNHHHHHSHHHHHHSHPQQQPDDSEDLRISEDSVEQLNFAMGAALKRAVSQDELAEFGASVLSKAESLDNKISRTHHRTCSKASTEVGEQTLASYSDMVQTNSSMSRLAYVLDFDDYVVQYVPLSGFVCANRMPKATPLDATQVPKEAIFVKIILNQNPANYALLKVLPTVTLAQLESFLINANAQKSKRVSLDVKVAEVVDKAINPFDMTPAFSKELHNILSFVKYFSTDDEVPDVPDKSVLFFAVETESTNENLVSKFQLVSAYHQSPIFVLAGQSGTTMEDAFVVQYMSKTYKTKKTLLEANSFPISMEVVEFLKNAAEVQPLDEVSPMLPTKIYSTLKALFFPQADSLIEALPLTSPGPHPHGAEESKPAFVDEFVFLICSPLFQIFPWELMLPRRRVFRSFSALQLSYNPLTQALTDSQDGAVRSINTFDKVSKKVASGLSVPRSTASMLKNVASLNFIVYHYDHFGVNNEKQRVQWLKEYELSNMFDSMKGPQKVVQNACGFPFQSPLSETGEKASKLKKKYKFVSFVDLSPFMKKRVDHPLKLTLRLVEDAYRFPVLVLPLSDLLECSDWMSKLMKSSGTFVLLFVPGQQLKRVVKELSESVEDSLKAASSGDMQEIEKWSEPFGFLQRSVEKVKANLRVPISTFFFPSA